MAAGEPTGGSLEVEVVHDGLVQDGEVLLLDLGQHGVVGVGQEVDEHVDDC